jgi:2,4-dienoyl-CoA reductase-like NADH-dependent reductase (Old Yellow Enzyme family)
MEHKSVGVMPSSGPFGQPPGEVIFSPLAFRNLTVKNRLFRSSISGRIDNYDGSGTPARINWEERFARGGVGAIISAHVPVHVRGRILPNYAFIDSDERIPFWRAVVARVHRHDCRFILQLSHAGRQQDVAGVENLGRKALSATSTSDSLHGFPCEAMSVHQIRAVVRQFADGARRAREAGCDGIELHAANGYLFTQFLSSAINDRKDDYGGSLENRARFLLEVISAIRREVGNDFHLQVKISAVDANNAVFPWERRGNALSNSIQIMQWAESAGADAVHVSAGNMFPHPINPAGPLPLDVAAQSYPIMLASGSHTMRNYMFFRYRWLRPLFLLLWNRTSPKVVEGANLPLAHALKKRLGIPVICTGGFQTASIIRNAIESDQCDAVSMARTLMANPDLPLRFAEGQDAAPRPCSYCNRCLINVLDHPLGCYDERRFSSHDEMIAALMAFYRGDYAEIVEDARQMLVTIERR